MLLKNTALPVDDVPAVGPAAAPTHSAAYWAARTRGMDFEVEDRLDANRYNRLLWAGLMGPRGYPARRPGTDLTAANAHVAPTEIGRQLKMPDAQRREPESPNR
jgi:hypothetical protein